MTMQAGVLLVENSYNFYFPGNIHYPDALPCEIAARIVPGAHTDVVVSEGFDTVREPYVQEGRRLQHEGADVISSNCGFSVVFQDDIAEATGLPTVMSSLLLAPLLARIYSGRIGILTFDASNLDAPRRSTAGWAADFDLPLADVRQSEHWMRLRNRGPTALDLNVMRQDLVEISQEFVDQYGLKALLIECCAMLPFERDIHEATGLPIFDHLCILHSIIDRTEGRGMPERPDPLDGYPHARSGLSAHVVEQTGD